MKDNPINDQPMDIFIIIAETLDKWQNPSSEAGRSVLMEHYQWGAELKAKNKLLMAGPIDFDLTSTHQIDPIGHTTGLIFSMSHQEKRHKIGPIEILFNFMDIERMWYIP